MRFTYQTVPQITPAPHSKKHKSRKNKRLPGNFTSGAIEIDFHTSREPSDCVATYIHTTNIHANANAPSHNKTYTYSLFVLLRIGEQIKQSFYVIQPRDQVQLYKSPYLYIYNM